MAQPKKQQVITPADDNTTDGSGLQESISRITLALMAVHGMTKHADLGDVLGMTASNVTRRLNGDRRWQIEDLATMAAYFDVSVASFFEDPARLFKYGGSSPALTLIQGDGLADQANHAEPAWLTLVP